MNKQELIDEVARGSAVSKVVARDVINSLLETVQIALADGQEVRLIGFGTFRSTDRVARVGRNPQNGNPLQIAAAKIPKFDAGSNLKAALNRI
jgi:DNA-binding protein HU-beta